MLEKKNKTLDITTFTHSIQYYVKLTPFLKVKIVVNTTCFHILITKKKRYIYLVVLTVHKEFKYFRKQKQIK